MRGEHTLYMIVESDDEARVREFMRPFALAGEVDVYPAATCAGVVSNGGCGAARPYIDRTVTALDPEEACQWAIDAGLVVHRAHPLNCETSLPALARYGQSNRNFVLVTHWFQAAFRPTASMSLSRSAMTRW